MNIKAAADAVGIPVKTVRYYADIGLVTPARQDNGYRAFDETQVHKLRFVARARGLGFSIDECRSLLTLWEDHGRAAADVKALAERRIEAIDRKMMELQELRGTLSRLVSSCQGGARPDCPILEDLAGAEEAVSRP